MKEDYKALKSILNSNGYSNISVLGKSDRKKTMVLKALKNYKWLVVKCWSKNSPDHVKAEIFNEIQWYKKLQGLNISPEFFEFGDNFFSIEYVGEDTIWSFPQKKELLAEEAFFEEKLIRLVIEFHKNAKALDLNALLVSNCVELLLSRLTNILFSGPKGTTRNNLIKTFALHLLYKIIFSNLRFKLIKELSPVCNELVTLSDRYHGDFHMNNVVLAKNLDCYLIDFECAKTGNPGFLADIMYMVTTLEGAVGRANIILEKLVSEFKFSKQAQIVLYKIFHIFLAALYCNNRFWSDKFKKTRSDSFLNLPYFFIKVMKL